MTDTKATKKEKELKINNNKDEKKESLDIQKFIKDIEENLSKKYDSKFETLQNELGAKEDLIKQQNQIIKQFQTNGGQNDNVSKLLESFISKSSQSDELVEIIHLDDCLQTMYKLSNGETITFKYYGEVYTTSKISASLLLNQYPYAFKNGIITFSDKHLYMLEQKGIDVTQINFKPIESIKNVHKLSVKELADFYKSLQHHQKELLKLHIIQELQKNNEEYMSMEKLLELNRLSRGGYKYIIEKVQEVKQY